MRIFKIVLAVVFFIATIESYAQTMILSSQVTTYSTAAEGDFYKDENDKVYIGMSDGSLEALGGGSASETQTDLSQNTSTGVITYVNEVNTSQIANVVSADANNVLKVGSDGGTFRSLNVFNCYDLNGGQTITTTASKINLDTETINSGGYLLSAGDVTLSEDGIYEIHYSVDFELTNGGTNANDEVRSELLLNGTPVAGSRTDASLSTTSAGVQSASRTLILNLSAGDVIAIWSVKNGNRNVITIPEGCGMTIKKLN
ncbi:hypothetical protein ACFQ1M_15470 [Sungkyunkwania multivorans]|uniref:C1q domain-containing protein n=1 Tax=Sungkyunkwania multivorans TaxID=1173618 RepID=A0ABW3D0L5_9FLAO